MKIPTPAPGTVKVIRVWEDGSYGVYTIPYGNEHDKIDKHLNITDDSSGEEWGAWDQVCNG